MPDHLSAIEQLVLVALLRLDDDAYGVAVQREIARRTGREPSFATVYTALARLEDRELISSRLGDATQERGGRRKKIYTVRSDGRRALQASLRDLRAMTRGIATLERIP
jgi:PadR family transcriptional regulator, regulatory protein PadR